MAGNKPFYFVLWSAPLFLAIAVILVVISPRGDESPFVSSLEDSRMLVFSEGRILRIYPDELDSQREAAINASINLRLLLERSDLSDDVRARVFALALLHDPEVIFQEGVANKSQYTREEFAVLLAVAEGPPGFDHLTIDVREQAWKIIEGIDYPEAEYKYAEYLFRQENAAAVSRLWHVVQRRNKFSGPAAQLLSRSPNEAMAAVEALFEVLADSKERDVFESAATSLAGIVSAAEDPVFFSVYREFRKQDTPNSRARIREELQRIVEQWRAE